MGLIQFARVLSKIKQHEIKFRCNWLFLGQSVPEWGLASSVNLSRSGIMKEYNLNAVGSGCSNVVECELKNQDVVGPNPARLWLVS